MYMNVEPSLIALPSYSLSQGLLIKTRASLILQGLLSHLPLRLELQISCHAHLAFAWVLGLACLLVHQGFNHRAISLAHIVGILRPEPETVCRAIESQRVSIT